MTAGAGVSPILEEKIIDDRLDELLILSIAILGENLQHSRPRVVPLGEGPYRFFRDHRIKGAVWGYNPFCRRQMRESGYYPLEIRRMESSIPSVTIV